MKERKGAWDKRALLKRHHHEITSVPICTTEGLNGPSCCHPAVELEPDPHQLCWCTDLPADTDNSKYCHSPALESQVSGGGNLVRGCLSEEQMGRTALTQPQGAQGRGENNLLVSSWRFPSCESSQLPKRR